MPALQHTNTNPTNDEAPSSEAVPPVAATRPAPTAMDRLQSIYRSPGPYTTVYLATRPLLPHAERDLDVRWREMRAELETQCAPLDALEAIDARLALPDPADTAAVCVIAAADGSTVVEYGMEPPRVDVGSVDTLPHVGPMLEWQQRRVPHLVVTADQFGADIVTFGADHFADLDAVEGDVGTIATIVSTAATAIGARLVVVGGDPASAQTLADELNAVTAPWCNVVACLDENVDQFADSTVRHVSDAAARTTVGYLRELRFLATHDAGIDGTDDTIAALVSGVPGVLLVHDDPMDQRRIWIGTAPFQLSQEKNTECRRQARLVDAAIWSAVLQGMDVHIIPTTGHTGPDDDTAIIDRRAPKTG
ncbi:MAG: hypothetical protein DHS20C19_01710 [Acidimicrobiales bacterium]|nr:MAG: hypothetical protein DHS20C19_01710 [Acidimicrobiales bacterium]